MPTGEKFIQLRREFIIFIYPPVLIVAGYFTFDILAGIWGNQQGFIAGMAAYWLIGCLLPAAAWISRRHRKLLLQFKKLTAWQWLLLLLPAALVLIFVPLTSGPGNAKAAILLLTFVLSLLHAFSEELFWRGLYYDHHQGNLFYATIVPSIWYGIWHYVPLSVMPVELPNFYFIVIATGLGFFRALITWQSHSVAWNIIVHALLTWLGAGILSYNSQGL